MRFSKEMFWFLFFLLVLNRACEAQSPVGLKGFTGSVLDYYTLRTLPVGDTSYFQAWGSDGNGTLPSILSFLPDPSGLPVLGTTNDGQMVSTATVNIGVLQLSKLPGPLTTATTGNTNIIDVNGMSSYGAGAAVNSPASWGSGNCTTGDGHTDCTWKGGPLWFRNNRLFLAPYRQPSPGGYWGDTSLVLSPDAGQTWVDYGRYNTYTVSGATCTSTTATLTTSTNALAGGAVVYIHDVGSSTAGVYNGKYTLTSATSTTMVYTVPSCAGGTYTSGGGVGPLAADGSAPLGPASGGYSVMWPQGSPMQWLIPINYGQDGAYPSGIDQACAPAVYMCGLSTYKAAGNGGGDSSAQMPTYLWRVPVGQEMTKASYQWYTSPGYSSIWPSPDAIADGNQSASWTSTAANATNLYYSGQSAAQSISGLYPEECYAVKYSATHKSYIMSCEVLISGGAQRMAYKWAPHPWGPWASTGYSDCSIDGSQINCSPPFQSIMSYGETVTSTTPPEIQSRLSTYVGLGVHSGNGSMSFWTANFNAGRPLPAGMARRAEFLGTAGQLGMGHRFTSGNMAGAISRRGIGYSLDWWADLWDHGGNANTNSRPWFRDVISGGVRYFDVYQYQATPNNAFAGTSSLQTSGPKMISGYDAQLTASFTDATISASSGNASWTVISVFNVTNPNGTGTQNEFNRPIPLFRTGDPNASTTGMAIQVGRDGGGSAGSGAGNVAVAWGNFQSATAPVVFKTAASLISTNTWYFLAVSAKANGSGFPTITMLLCSAGSCTEYGGVNMATSGDGSTGGGLTKTCPSGGCSTTPAVTATAPVLGHTLFESVNGILGDQAVYSGVVSTGDLREIYRTVRAGWARVGRGAL